MRYSVFANSCPLLTILNMGYASDSAVTRFGPGARDLYIIHFVISGKGYFNGTPVGRGQGFLITPGMDEHYYPDERDPWDFLWIVSNDKKMSAMFDYFPADKTTNVFDYSYTYAVKELSALLIEKSNTILNPFEMLELFLRIFKHQQTEPVPHKTTNADVYLAAAEKYVHSNMHMPVTVAELTEFLGVSQPYLFKIFKERYGKSPKQYVMDQKLTRAQTLLRETDMTVTHIANSVGFPDAQAFSKCFRGKLGLSPQHFRAK